MAKSRPIGAGGDWRTIGERPRRVQRQQTPLACAYACIQMIAARYGVQLTQKQAARGQSLNDPAYTLGLAKLLNHALASKAWRSEYVVPSIESLDILRAVCPWIAGLRSRVVLRTGMSIGPEHAVVIRQIKPRAKRILIDDPYDPSCYEMMLDDFLESWTGFATFSMPLKSPPAV